MSNAVVSKTSTLKSIIEKIQDLSEVTYTNDNSVRVNFNDKLVCVFDLTTDEVEINGKTYIKYRLDSEIKYINIGNKSTFELIENYKRNSMFKSSVGIDIYFGNEFYTSNEKIILSKSNIMYCNQNVYSTISYGDVDASGFVTYFSNLLITLNEWSE